MISSTAYDTDEMILAVEYYLQGRSDHWVRRQISTQSHSVACNRMVYMGMLRNKITGVWRKKEQIPPCDMGLFDFGQPTE